MERLGGSRAFGSQLLRILELQGWTVAELPAFAGGVLVIASKNGLEVRRAGGALADVAIDVFKESSRMQVLGLAEHVQLELA